MYGICNLSIIPCRKKPSDASEMVTQLLFGEHFEIIHKEKNWYHIRCAYDSYECWIDKKQCHEISKETFNKLSKATITPSLDLIQIITNTTDKFSFPIVIGSSLPNFGNNECDIENNKYHYEGQLAEKTKKPQKNSLIEYAYMFLNTPYLWGGRSPFGIDCSGFTQIVYKLSGIKIKRDASEQVGQGVAFDFVEEALPGDLAFFGNKEGKIIHVGIILANNQIIHASGKVRIDTLDHHGIFNVEMKKYSHKLRIIKRIV